MFMDKAVWTVAVQSALVMNMSEPGGKTLVKGVDRKVGEQDKWIEIVHSLKVFY